MTLYGIKNCDTCKRALKWLHSHGHDVIFHDFRVDGLTENLINDFLDRSGWQALLNKNSTSWRQLSTEQQSELTREKALRLMLATPTLIKRPVLDIGNKQIIGFNTERYQAEL